MPQGRKPELQPANLLAVGQFAGSWAELGELARQSPAERLLGASGRIAVVVDSDLEALQILSLFATAPAADLLLLPRSRLTDGVKATITERGFVLAGFDGSILAQADAQCEARPGVITLLTSGSTGTPKLVAHTLETLFTAARARSSQPGAWMVPYQTGTYAWFQLVTKGMFSPEQKLVFPASSEPAVLFETAIHHGVTSISATPTFWRLAMLQVDAGLLRSVPLRQIALGGEVVDQSLLDQLAQIYPLAEISHVYASTEVGACIVVKDRMAGFPESLLGRRDGSPELRIRENRLEVRSPFAARDGVSRTADEGWIDTGDIVEVRDGRVYFCGRADAAMINVGGNKAFPADIAAAIQKHPAVAWSRVRAVRAPLVGHLAEADVVLRPGHAPVDEAALTKHCAENLPEYAVPRFWNFLPAIPVEGSLKSAL